MEMNSIGGDYAVRIAFRKAARHVAKKGGVAAAAKKAGKVNGDGEADAIQVRAGAIYRQSIRNVAL